MHTEKQAAWNKSGDEAKLLPYIFMDVNTCKRYIMIFLFDAACAEGDIRLLNETSDVSGSLYTFRGQVVVCVGGAYQPICDIGWDDNDARVACVLRYGSRYGKRVIQTCTNNTILCRYSINFPFAYLTLPAVDTFI